MTWHVGRPSLFRSLCATQPLCVPDLRVRFPGSSAVIGGPRSIAFGCVILDAVARWGLTSVAARTG